eukprot:7285975-Ditylum_brightwellii.AAC.1
MSKTGPPDDTNYTSVLSGLGPAPSAPPGESPSQSVLTYLDTRTQLSFTKPGDHTDGGGGYSTMSKLHLQSQLLNMSNPDKLR